MRLIYAGLEVRALPGPQRGFMSEADKQLPKNLIPENERSLKQQRELLTQSVEKLVKQFGPEILDFLGEKYALVLPEFEHLRQK